LLRNGGSSSLREPGFAALHLALGLASLRQSTGERGILDSVIRPPDLSPVKPWRMIARGLRRRCPRCNGSGWWTGWLKRVPCCRSCGYRYEREDGFSLGAITINMIATFLLLGLLFAVGFFLSYPSVAVAPMLIIGGIVVAILPVAFYPLSYTVWAAIDLVMRPLDAGEEADAMVALMASDLGKREDA
jgi:uncharacterized protein (DUF983 family)